MKKVLALLLCLFIVATALVACGGGSSSAPAGTASQPAASTPADSGGDEALESFPREETLYFNGLHWGPPTHVNPLAGSPTSMVVQDPSASANARVLLYESLFLYNPLDNQLYPLLGTEYSWDGNTLTVKLNPDAKWSDGEPVTAEDVAYTFNLGQKYETNTYVAAWTHLESVTAVDDTTVEFVGKDPLVPLAIEQVLGSYYILPEHIWAAREEEVNEDNTALLEITNWDAVGSGPYKVLEYNDTQISLIRDDNYWGQAASMWGKLPEPKYIVHNIFKDNAAGDAAFKEGQVDVSQQYIAQVWTYWEQGLPVSTYDPDPPYYYPGALPSMWFNSTTPGLDDYAVRKAIAMVTNYEMIGQNAMSGYTAPWQASMMLPTDSEQAMIDLTAMEPYMFTGNNAEEAAALLDEAGWVPGSDGIREKDGVKLSFQIECPDGWTDWNASAEVVANAARAVGIDIQTYFPDMGVWSNDLYTGNFSIIITSMPGSAKAGVYTRMLQVMSDASIQPIGERAVNGNYGRFSIPGGADLVEQLASETDPEAQKDLVTQLNILWLENLPVVPLMYRPSVFHTVNESVWTGFPQQDDGSNIPPLICIDGYGVAALYNLTNAG